MNFESINVDGQDMSIKEATENILGNLDSVNLFEILKNEDLKTLLRFRGINKHTKKVVDLVIKGGYFSVPKINKNMDGFFQSFKDLVIFTQSVPLWVILNSPTRKWNWVFVSGRIDVTTSIIDAYPNKPWHFGRLSKHIPLEYINKNIDRPWNWSTIARRNDLYIDYVIQNQDKFKRDDWWMLSANPNITIDMVEKYPDLPWRWDGLSRNTNMTINIVNSYPDDNWTWDNLSEHMNIYSVLANLDKPWDWYILTDREDVTWEIIYRFIVDPITKERVPWDWVLLMEDGNDKVPEEFKQLIRQRMAI